MFAWEKFYSKKAVGEAGNSLSEIKVLPLVMIFITFMPRLFI